MAAARPPAPARDTGLPPGVQVGPLGRRFVAYVVDSVVPAVAAVLVSNGSNRGSTALVVVGVLLALAWGIVCWWQLAVRAASPGMRLLKLQLVGFFDGRPTGWGRVFLRWLVYAALNATGLGLLLLLASVLLSPRHQGWHDRAAGAVVIAERPLAPPRSTTRPAAASTSPERPAAVNPGFVAPLVEPAADDPAADDSAADDAAAASAVGDPDPAVAVAPMVAPLAGDAALPPEPAAQPSASGQPAPSGSAAQDPPVRRTILDGWVAELDDGREIAVRGLVLLGRNPQPGEGEADAQLVKLPDESRTVSKTHLALGVDDAGLFVVDRGSTNGSTITPPGQPTVPVGPFHAVSVGDGSVVSIGDHWLRIRRLPD